MSSEPAYIADDVAAQAMLPMSAAAPTVVHPSYALVEIFSHRSHYAEVREVEAFGAKLLELTDLDTGKTHRYGGASVFSLTLLSHAEVEAHLEAVKRQKERMGKYEAAYEQQRLAREAHGDDGESMPF